MTWDPGEMGDVGGKYVIQVSHFVAKLSTDIYTLHFGQLWFSMLTTVHHTKKLL